MAYVFRIHDVHPGVNQGNVTPTHPTAAANIASWGQSGYIVGDLIDNIELAQNPRKMGTSIPSIFSRVFLFDGAFSIVGADVQKHGLINPNTRLISECLDMLEFLFQNGGNGKLIIRHWNKENNIATLRNDGIAAHTKLADVLDNEIQHYPELADIYLFYWKDVDSRSQNEVECLLGGTSPYTMVFTSPNWKREIDSHGWMFNGLSGARLFDDNVVTSIENRAPKFREYVYSVYNAYSIQMNGMSIRTYLNGAWTVESNNFPGVAAMGANPGLFNQTYKILETTGNHFQVFTNAVPIAANPQMPANSDYEIVCTSNRYQTYNHNGATISINNVPLALNDSGLGKTAKYYDITEWDHAICKINDAQVRGLALHQRILPVVGVTYPFVVASDFLEDSIIKLPYAIDSTHFKTAFAGDSQYLLPLKPYFFQFFNIEDLDREVEGNRKMLTLENTNDGVKAVLRIPVKHILQGANANSVVKFEKNYNSNNIVSDRQSEINIGIFPFYRNIDIIDNLTPQNQNANDHNKYVVALAAWDNVNLYFSSVENGVINVAKRENRSRQGQTVSGTFYYDVNSAFDFIQVNIGNTHGMLVPEFKNVDIQNVAGNANFAIDFGTSNTYVAMQIGVNPPEPLTIDSVYPLVVFTKNREINCSSVSIRNSEVLFEREFVPSVLGGTGSTAEFPIRTASCELNNFEALPPHLFGNISVGFNYMNEVINAVGGLIPFNYVTDLKWAIENGKPNYQNRVKLYFKGLLWIIKCKCLMENHGLPGQIFITFPNAMTVPTRNALLALWGQSMTDLNLDPNNHLMEDNESVAPYHAMATTIMGASFMNMDIGGGTTDVLFIQKSGGQIVRSLYSSAKFAADDLWGDGVNITITGAAGPKDNGFKTHMDQIINQIAIDNDLRNKYTSVCTIAKSSSDILGFMFKHENVFHTGSNISGQPNLLSLLIIHYAALMYNVSRMMIRENLDIPEKVSFTGMGSLYTKMISAADADLTVLTRIMLETFTGKRAPVLFSVTRQPNSKKMTADGALIGPGLDPNFKVNPANLVVAGDYGFDTNNTIMYNQVTNNNIKEEVVKEYNKFLSLLSSGAISNHLAAKYSHTIKDSLIADLKAHAESSYSDVCHLLTAHGNMPLQETLFFLPLKQAIYEVSKNYQNYK